MMTQEAHQEFMKVLDDLDSHFEVEYKKESTHKNTIVLHLTDGFAEDRFSLPEDEEILMVIKPKTKTKER